MAEQHKRAPESTPPSPKRQKCDHGAALINPAYLEQDFLETLSEVFCQNGDKDFDNGAQFISKPFRCCILPDFIDSAMYTSNLVQGVDNLMLTKKSTDLYQFSQSNDISLFSHGVVPHFKHFLGTKCAPFLKKLTQFELTDDVDVTYSLYSYTDVLLCHDDQLEDRKIAYIYYLVRDWKAEDGGTLDLFHSENGEPTTIAKSILPKFNTFVFFEVSKTSFHQVSEILCKKSRMSLNGWFHSSSPFPTGSSLGQVAEKPSTSIPRTVTYDAATVFETPMSQWINRTYLETAVQRRARVAYNADSVICLEEFLEPGRYTSVRNALREQRMGWKMVGPPNRSCYDRLTELPGIVRECVDFLKSLSFCYFLSHLTGLNFHGVKMICPSRTGVVRPTVQNIPPRIEPKVRSDIRRWGHRYYSLLHDGNCSADGVEATLSFGFEDWNVDAGGTTTYLNKTNDENVWAEPKINSLAIVRTTKNTTSFVKYLNCLSRPNDFFYDFNIKYYEQSA